jgi:hypothetical protein
LDLECPSFLEEMNRSRQLIVTTVRSFTVLLFAAVCAYGQLKSSEVSERPAVAFVTRGVLHLATISGHILKTIKTAPEIGTFAIAPDAEKILFSSAGKTLNSYGGQLYLMSLSNPVAKLRTHGPYYNKKPRPQEVYSDPDFAPDGTRAVFSIHSQPSGDLVEASGPFATINLRTGAVSVLASTLHVPGEAWGTAFAGNAYWSPDGQRILLNFEDGFSLTDPEGKTLEEVALPLTDSEWTSSLGWIGSECIVFIGGKDYEDAQKNSAQFLNLKTHKSGSLATLLQLKEEQVTGLVAISGAVRVRRQGSELLVESGDYRWKIPDSDSRTQVRIVPVVPSEAPTSCR